MSKGEVTVDGYETVFPKMLDIEDLAQARVVVFVKPHSHSASEMTSLRVTSTV